MTEQPQAGARVRIVIEDTIESRSESGDWTTTGGINLTGVTPQNATTTILEPGWQPGDIVNDGHSDLFRIRRQDGVHMWQRPNGQHVYDDETSLASLTTIHTADAPAGPVTFTVTHLPDPPELQREIARLRREWPGGTPVRKPLKKRDPMLSLVPVPIKVSSDTDPTHIYCCNPDLALCGTDISNTPHVDQDGILCVVCEDLEDQECTCQTTEQK